MSGLGKQLDCLEGLDEWSWETVGVFENLPCVKVETIRPSKLWKSKHLARLKSSDEWSHVT